MSCYSVYQVHFISVINTIVFILVVTLRPPLFPRFPYTTLFRSVLAPGPALGRHPEGIELLAQRVAVHPEQLGDRKSTRLNSSHLVISYAVFCLKKKITMA